MKRIFMLSRQKMFSQGVEHLLKGQPGLEIVGREAGVDAALQQIRTLAPDIVILDSKDLESAPASIITSILKQSPCSKIITLNLENDQARVYLGQQRSARTVDDLLEVVFEEMPGGEQISPLEWAGLAAARVQAYEFLAAVFSRRLDPALLVNLGLGSFQWIGSIEQIEDLTGDLNDAMRALERFFAASSGYLPGDIQATLLSEHARLLDPCSSSKKLLPDRETAYVCIDAASTLSLLNSLSQVYAAANVTLSKPMCTQPDFIACELAFMHILCSREADAWNSTNRRLALPIQAQEAAFIKEHLVRWLPRFCDALLLHTRHDFFRGLAHLAKGFIFNEAYRVADLMEVAAADDPLSWDT